MCATKCKNKDVDFLFLFMLLKKLKKKINPVTAELWERACLGHIHILLAPKSQQPWEQKYCKNNK